MQIQDFYRPVSAVYNAAKYAVTRPKESVFITAFGGLGLLAACGSDKEATPLEIATRPPSEPGATIQAQRDLFTPGAYGLAPIPTATRTPEPTLTPTATVGIEQNVSDNPSKKARKVYDFIKSQTPKEGVIYYDRGYYGVIAKMFIGTTPYTVQVGNQVESRDGRSTTIYGNQTVTTDFDLDGLADYGLEGNTIFNAHTGQGVGIKVEDPPGSLQIRRLEDKFQFIHEEKLRKLIKHLGI